MDWTYNSKPYSPTDSDYGFIYLITYSDGTHYLGKKDFFTVKRLPALKSGECRPNSIRTYKNQNGSRVYYDLVKCESNWRKYNGSSHLVKGKTPVSKEILCIAPSKRNLTYLEVKYLFLHNALEDPTYLNENILGKFFRDNLI